ncbi:MAG: MarR family transcriptional regulator [Dactylosporangium sp.]|nr:MarR family transcriptional regulator [Dactylosporangium sp.]NNJ59437.1 MarR family transcriptional regulator [Dactylosporangium sp.]
MPRGTLPISQVHDPVSVPTPDQPLTQPVSAGTGCPPEAGTGPVVGHNGGVSRSHPTSPSADAASTDVVDALLSASRALVGLAARSLADLDADVTLPQYRALVVLASRGPQRIVDIAAELGVTPSTGTRMCDRLVRKELAHRTRSDTDRRAVWLTLTPAGRALVDEVTRRRREELVRIVAVLPGAWHDPVATALRSFAAAAGEVPEHEWWLGWTDSSAQPKNEPE